MKMCEAFAKLGHETTLYLGTNKKEEIKLHEGDVFSFYGVDELFKINKIELNINSIQALISSFYAKFNGSDICYTRSVYAASLMPRLGIHTIFEADNPIHWKFDKHIAPLLLTTRNLKILSISKSLTDIFVRNYKIAPRRVLTRANGVDLDRFRILESKSQLRKELNLPSDEMIICYAGSLYNGRGVDLLLSISSKLPQGMLLIIVGGKSRDLERYVQISKDLKCENVRFTGFVPTSSIPKYLTSSDILIMPYLSNAEDPGGNIQTDYMSPMKMFEYMAAGRPIIASRINTINEILKDGENALLFDPGDEASLLNAIERVAGDTIFSERIASKAQNDVKNYTWIKRASDVISFMKDFN